MSKKNTYDDKYYEAQRSMKLYKFNCFGKNVHVIASRVYKIYQEADSFPRDISPHVHDRV